MTERVPEQQYGALPWRRTDGVEILLITSRQTRRWLTPKGWPIDGLSPSEGAAQEAYEEAGVRGVANGQSLGSYSYEKKLREGVGRLCRVAMFSLEVTETLENWPESHERERRWFTAEEAADLVGEPALAAIIRDFARDQSAPAMQAPTYLREVLQRLTNALRRVAAL